MSHPPKSDESQISTYQAAEKRTFDVVWITWLTVVWRIQGLVMRGSDATTGYLFSHVDLEGRILRNHLLRTIRTVVNDALESLDGDFEGL